MAVAASPDVATAAMANVAVSWPGSAAELEREQRRLANLSPSLWRPTGRTTIAGCFVCFPRGGGGSGAKGDRAWAAAVAMNASRVVAESVVEGVAAAGYQPGLLALREGPLLERAVRALRARPDVVLVDATGRDHPRRAGLALQLGAVLDLPTVGVTHRPLTAEGDWPAETHAGATSPLVLDGEVAGLWLRTRPRVRPLAVHPGWRTDARVASDIVLSEIGRARMPEPLRAARRLARMARAGSV